jgi:hypothetical protein
MPTTANDHLFGGQRRQRTCMAVPASTTCTAPAGADVLDGGATVDLPNYVTAGGGVLANLA